jgi:guanylate kinase
MSSADFADYHPNTTVLNALRQVHLVGVVGPTAVGKSTVVKRAKELDPSLHIVLSTVTRPPRPGEYDGVDYHFRDRQSMLQRIQQREFVQVPPSLLGDLYATAPEDYSSEGVSVLAHLAQIVPTLRALPFAQNRTVFVLPPSWDAWQERITHHHFTPAQMGKRMAEALDSLAFACHDPEVIFVLNDQIDVAAEAFLAIVRGNAAPAEQQAACRALAASFMEQLQAELTTEAAELIANSS